MRLTVRTASRRRCIVWRGESTMRFLIHNAFAISVGERTKQFGLLSSVGATRKQIRKTILYEALIVGGMGTLPGGGLPW